MEQSEDSDIGLLIWLLKSDKLKKYVDREMDSSEIWVLKYRKDLFLKNRIVVSKSGIEKSLRTNISVCLT